MRSVEENTYSYKFRQKEDNYPKTKNVEARVNTLVKSACSIMRKEDVGNDERR